MPDTHTLEENPRVVIGGNNPPVSIFDDLQSKATALVETANRWLTERPKIEDEATAEKAVAFKAQLDELLKRAEAARVEEKKPHDDAAKAVQTKFKGLMTPAENALALLKPRIADYLRRKEQERQRQEAKARAEAQRKIDEAARLAREAEELAAAAAQGDLAGSDVDVVEAQTMAQAAIADAKEADKAARAIERAPSNVKSAGAGRTASLRTSWTAEIEDHAKALKHFKDHPAIKEAVQNLANALARNPVTRDMPVPGVKFVELKGL